jgi:class 3 adenylate cyclase
MDYFADDSSVADHSVGSLAAIETNAGGAPRRKEEEKVEDEQSPDRLVEKKSRSVACTKWLLLFLLVVSGIFLTVSTFVTRKETRVEDSGRSDATTYASVVAGIFSVLIMVFLRYDYLVARRQSLVIDMAKRSKTIVDSLFPSMVRERLLQDNSGQFSIISAEEPVSFSELTKINTLANKNISESDPIRMPQLQSKATLKSVRESEGAALDHRSSQPIADLYKNATVLFADIAGFTAWSAERDPPQVFKLLETVYAEFDSIAEKLKVFKVETIGDSYMAVTGVPEPDPDHAVTMAKFAYQCLVKMDGVTSDLETLLGSGTKNLHVRVGLHSGPVTAGVLRGQKSRFQLFGDTVNTASRMESTGEKRRIQVSLETAELLIAAGKMHWVKERQDQIVAKGKGQMRTFWLDPHKKSKPSGEDNCRIAAKNGSVAQAFKHTLVRQTLLTDATYVSPWDRRLSEDKYGRLIDWNTDIFLENLSRVMAYHHSGRGETRSVKTVNHRDEDAEMPPPYNSVADVIFLPAYDPNARHQPPMDTELAKVRLLLREFIADIAALYNDVPFHNFAHASHVTLATSKILSRIAKLKDCDEMERHEISYGISSDPLTQFSVVFSALVHDVGHSGVPNSQLVVEEAEVALQFRNRSVAEQNSVVLAWKLLMQPKYRRLRTCIYKTNVERKRFRQVMINCVMATDISDREINQFRVRKWDKAFKNTDKNTDRRGLGGKMTRDEINRKATVVLECIIQAADIAHTMQHWHVYRKWNDKLFEERYKAYLSGRASFDPADNWFAGELGFFDHYVIPLSKRISESGIFGLGAGSVYETMARENRQEWERDGQASLRAMIKSAHQISLFLVEETDENSLLGDNDSVEAVR